MPSVGLSIFAKYTKITYLCFSASEMGKICFSCKRKKQQSVPIKWAFTGLPCVRGKSGKLEFFQGQRIVREFWELLGKGSLTVWALYPYFYPPTRKGSGDIAISLASVRLSVRLSVRRQKLVRSITFIPFEIFW